MSYGQARISRNIWTPLITWAYLAVTGKLLIFEKMQILEI